MKRIFAGALAGIAMTAAPAGAHANAQEAPWYAGIDVGASFLEAGRITPTGGFGYTPGPQAKTTVKASTSLDVDAVFGHQFDHFRLEAEIANKTAANSGYNSTGYTAYPTATSYGVILPGNYTGVTGHQNVLSGMVNGMADLGKTGGFKVSLGGGVGVARVQDSLGVNGYGAVLRDSDTGFAWQLLGGVRVPVGPKVDLGIKYRYFNVTGLKLASLLGTRVSTDYHSHSVLLGVSFKIGHGE